MVNQSHSKWLRSVLQHHTAYLMSNPHCHDLLGPVYATLEARTRHYSKLVQLKGKLDEAIDKWTKAFAKTLNLLMPTRHGVLPRLSRTNRPNPE